MNTRLTVNFQLPARDSCRNRLLHPWANGVGLLADDAKIQDVAIAEMSSY